MDGKKFQPFLSMRSPKILKGNRYQKFYYKISVTRWRKISGTILLHFTNNRTIMAELDERYYSNHPTTRGMLDSNWSYRGVGQIKSDLHRCFPGKGLERGRDIEEGDGPRCQTASTALRVVHAAWNERGWDLKPILPLIPPRNMDGQLPPVVPCN